MQMDGRQKELWVSPQGKYRPLSLIKGHRRHGKAGMQAGTFVTRNFDSAFICDSSVFCVNGPLWCQPPCLHKQGSGVSSLFLGSAW